jgi:hypothetical protein
LFVPLSGKNTPEGGGMLGPRRYLQAWIVERRDMAQDSMHSPKRSPKAAGAKHKSLMPPVPAPGLAVYPCIQTPSSPFSFVVLRSETIGAEGMVAAGR